MKIYILDQRKDNTKHNAVGKAMTDVFKVMEECSVKTVPGVPKDASKLLKIFDLVILAVYCIFVFGRKDYCIYVYQDNAVKIKMLRKLRFLRRYKTICLINDVNSIRSDGIDSAKNANEIARDFALIGSANVVLAPNEGSKAILLDRGIKSEIETVGVWDYLMDEQMGSKCDSFANSKLAAAEKGVGKWKIGFAGNLGKSAFLDEIGEVVAENIEYHLWGDEAKNRTYSNYCIYEGSVSPNVLPLEIAEKCDFGLVWDGSSAHRIQGGYGEYLRFNNSHKCGCYLASGVPVIVWAQSGMAHFVKDMGCGILIEGLGDIPGILNDITVEEYTNLSQNARKAAENIRNGNYIKMSLARAVGKEQEYFTK